MRRFFALSFAVTIALDGVDSNDDDDTNNDVLLDGFDDVGAGEPSTLFVGVVRRGVVNTPLRPIGDDGIDALVVDALVGAREMFVDNGDIKGVFMDDVDIDDADEDDDGDNNGTLRMALLPRAPRERP